jgi:transposase
MSPRAEPVAEKFNSVEAAAEHIVELQDRLAKLEADLEYSNEKIKLFQRHLFLSSQSEKKPAKLPEQEGLFNEAEGVAQIDPDEAQDDLIAVPAHSRARTRGKPKRKPLPENLPRKIIDVTLPESERVCPHDAKLMVEIGEEISEQLDFVPAHVEVKRIRRKKYACPSKCPGAIKTAPPIPQPIPKSMASAGLLAHLCVSKYLDSLPLYRQESMFARLNIELSRSTMGSWMIRCGELIQPLVNLLLDEQVASSYLHADETKVQVLKEEGRAPESLSWMWVLARPGPQPIVVFNYEKTRAGSVPKRLLDGFKGFLQVDGYGGYNAVSSKGDVIRLGCMMHVRRKFHEAMLSSKKGRTGKRGRAFIAELYRVEKECAELTAEERKKYRDLHARPILDQFRAWIEAEIRVIPPKSIAGRALGYAYREWEYVTRYMDDGRLSIDNGFAENQIRPFAVGRKNWLFCDTEKGAESSANLYSLLVTAKLNGLNAYEYLKDVLARLPLAKTIEDLEVLLPTRWKPAAVN